ncbi:MAG: MjaI family restriction endonuclease, partial [Candidatus Marinimicrobia bacterium]|nr:MjaI family restriction endonuclease [Candidatus Neomarinimicrobiota bacterium]
MKVRISFDDIRNALEASAPDLPKYVYPLLNLSNQFAQGTRPKVVGKMSELIQEFPGKTLDEWTEWYQKNHPEAIQNATDKIKDNLNKLKHAMNEITEEMINNWVTDLVIVKTFLGLRVQEAVLKNIANKTNNSYRLANPDEESKGIDGF